MLIRIKRNTVAGRRAVSIGEVVDVVEGEARYLVALGKAEFPQPAEPSHRPPALETDTPASAALVATETAMLNAARPRARPRKD